MVQDRIGLSSFKNKVCPIGWSAQMLFFGVQRKMPHADTSRHRKSSKLSQGFQCMKRLGRNGTCLSQGACFCVSQLKSIAICKMDCLWSRSKLWGVCVCVQNHKCAYKMLQAFTAYSLLRVVKCFFVMRLY